eukprot:CAMPEP_0196583840 /NCGR_PEP_ID=MMETSP1081-20130531/44895_1 /TAXON_ID=36882 /ORGANISM="Pyramimonas amylifera, Strain CCMP720" /LENGTH=316 /DNA_ID=CAMNT_0041904859 /DNA_START=235 /DNA_END=1185 /DNA_ORIENTATION=+
MYEPKYYWFGSLTYVHMGLLTVVALCGGSEPLAQIIVALLLLIFRILVQFYFRPYLQDWRDMHHSACHLCNLLVILQGLVYYIRDCDNFDFGDDSGKCFDIGLVNLYFWLIIAFTAIVILLGFYVDRLSQRNSSQKGPDGVSLFFMDVLSQPRLNKWLLQDDKAARHVRRIEKNLHGWLNDQGIEIKCNQFRHVEHPNPAAVFFMNVLEKNKYFFDWCTTLDVKQRDELLKLTRDFVSYSSLCTLNRAQSLSALVKPSMIPHLTLWLMVSKKANGIRLQSVQESWQKFCEEDADQKRVEKFKRKAPALGEALQLAL